MPATAEPCHLPPDNRSSPMIKRLLLAAALATTATFAIAAPVTYKLDPSHTNVIAQWNHFGFSNPVAHFGQAEGVLVYDAENVAASSVKVTLPLSGLNTFTAKFDEHVLGSDFFDAAKFPVATFHSTAVESAGEGKLKVTGELTIKDNTHPVVLDVTLNKVGENMGKQPTIGFDAHTTIKRSDFGVGMYAPGVSDEVDIRITTEASVAKAK
ncbi:polyisoprenoid-binding protein [Lysobacter ciconiae]|uniref:Polyisoprenoid-binding protein n=2 Tax=Novilysobacter ciconiae TaxID=2781022 RepID=A0A7S6UGI0_9GAMM|nr:polyisoprenoid-binding protein [Lysobacter ciconiae]